MLLNKKLFKDVLAGKVLIRINNVKEAERVINQFQSLGFSTNIRASQLVYPSYLGGAIYTESLWNYADTSIFSNIPVVVL